ncbi:MAG TPA: FHIPEP family type III secretion protein, partial [Kofleriaceae bacterium]|nr:FHIPEP family type III secretion protein [Kofleriaceae bacterium]
FGGAVIAASVRPKVTTLDEAGADRVRGPRVALHLSPYLHKYWTGESSSSLHRVLEQARAQVRERTGVPVPPLAVRLGQGDMADDEIGLAIDETVIHWVRLDPGPPDAQPLVALEEKLPGELEKLVPELIGVDRAAALVEAAAVHAPVLVREVVPRVISLPLLAEVLRHLAREHVPLADVSAVLEAIALAPAPQGGFTARDVPALVEQLRGQLRRQISARWAPRGQLSVFTVDAMIEDAVRSAIDRREGGQVLALEPAIAQDIVAAVKGKLGTGPGVILTSGDVRRHLRALLEPELPDVAILAAHELAPGTAVTTAGRIDVA